MTDAALYWSTALQEHAAAYEAFQAAAWALPFACREAPGACGTWTAREVICHSTGWEAAALQRLRLIRSDPTVPDQDYDDDQFNAAAVAARQGQSWLQALADLALTHARLRAFLATVLPAVALADSRYAAWMVGRTTDFAEHTDQLRH